ncbi:hypothetical protein OIU77_012551 [Salix suchowensis]|uniref:Uncharacterized protein n=1 Tax=Salix suchowensis TaxID=1278906 RepID=A0ABQ9A441_9ROSI|nr:hypothetical protein OIU77_012551 [Salix suchowensis]
MLQPSVVLRDSTENDMNGGHPPRRQERAGHLPARLEGPSALTAQEIDNRRSVQSCGVEWDEESGRGKRCRRTGLLCCRE